MSLKDTLRKAASLLVELPPEEAQATLSSSDAERVVPDVDRFFAELEKQAADTPSKTPPSGAIPTAPAAPKAPPKTVEQIVREAPGPNLDEISVSAVAPALRPDGGVDFAAIYQAANLPKSNFTAEQVLEMLAALPKELPLETRRQTLHVTLNAVGKTLGATPETIVADASRKLAALSAFAENLTRETNEFTSRTEAEIAALEAQILEKREAMQSARQKLQQAGAACDRESDRLDDVLEFFSLDVAPSRYAGAPPSRS